jgi:hypothetical protein
MNNKKISWELSREDLEKFKPLYDVMDEIKNKLSNEIARKVDKEIIEKSTKNKKKSTNEKRER